MSEIVVGVKLKGDGSGLVGVLRGVASELANMKGAGKAAADGTRELASASDTAAKKSNELAGAVAQAGDTAGRSARQHSSAGSAMGSASAASTAYANAQGRLSGQLTPVIQKQAELNRTMASASLALMQGGISADEYKKRLRAVTDGSHEVTQSLGLQRAGWFQVGQQSQDVLVQYASGTKLTTIFAQQSGQFATALALIGAASDGSKGKMGAFMSFLGGPWGIAIGVAVSALGVLAQKYFDAGDAAVTAKAAASGLADAQSVLGEIFDLTSGKLKKQNDLLIANARLMAITLRSEALKEKASAESVFGSAGDLSYTQIGRAGLSTLLPGPLGSIVSGDYYGSRENQQQLRALEAERKRIAAMTDDEARGKALSELFRQVEKADFSGLGVDRTAYLQAIMDSVSSSAKTETAREIDKSLDEGELASGLRRPGNAKKEKDSSAKEAERLANWGERAAEAVARINDEFNQAPRDVDRARQATAQLDRVIKDINDKLRSGKGLTEEQRVAFEGVKQQAIALKPIIEESLARPIRDMLQDQVRDLEIGQMRLTGREADARALELTYQLMDKLGVENEEQLATELARRGVRGEEIRQLYDNLAAMREQTREMQVQQELQQTWLSALSGGRDAVHQMLQDLRTEGPKAVGDFFSGLAGIGDRLFADVLTEKLFGNLFRDLEDQVTGADKVSEAGDRIATAVDNASDHIDALGRAASGAAAALRGEKLAPVSGAAVAANEVPQPGDITILGRLKESFRAGYEDVFDDLKKGLDGVFTRIFGDRGIFSETTAKTLGSALGGAQLGGALGKGITDALGIRGSSTGAAIGGAGGQLLGNLLGSGLGPVGSIVGGVLGSLVGGLFQSAPRASAVVTSVSEKSTVTGNDGEAKQAVTAAAGSIQQILNQVIGQVGGTAGPFSVSIGQYKDYYRVSASGAQDPSAKYFSNHNTNPDSLYDGPDQQTAILIAVRNAIQDGAVQGISAAMKQALTSTTDVDAAVREALKVRQVEELLGGLTYQLEKQFKDFETQAAERVRIARQYGFDVVAIEKRNAEDRVALVDQILSARTGSLQALLDDLSTGDLFEGTAVDKRDALLAKIATTRTAAEAGEDGAADELAALQRQLIQFTRDAFGTAGPEYASDRANAASAAEAVIKAENERLKAAQDAANNTVAALTTANQIATQQAQLLQQIAQYQQEMANLMAANGGYVDTSAQLAALYRMQQLR